MEILLAWNQHSGCLIIQELFWNNLRHLERGVVDLASLGSIHEELLVENSHIDEVPFILVFSDDNGPGEVALKDKSVLYEDSSVPAKSLELLRSKVFVLLKGSRVQPKLNVKELLID